MAMTIRAFASASSRVASIAGIVCMGLPIRWGTPAPGLSGSAAGQQEHLHEGARRKRLHDGAAGWLDLRGRLANFHAGNSCDFLSKRVGGGREQLSMKLLYLSGA